MTASELAKLQGMLEGSHALNEYRRLEQERSTWMTAMTESNSLAEQIKKLVGQDSAAVQMAKQMYDAQKTQEDSIRKMLDPLVSIRSGLLADGSIQRMIDEFSKPFAATDHFTKLMDQVARPSAYLQSLHLVSDTSIEHARRMLAETSVSTGLQQVMKSFEEANKHWTVPSALLESLSPLKAWQEQVGKLSLPVMDWASAAALAKVLGQDGIESQLAAWGINPDGSANPQFVDQDEDGLGLSRKSMELMALLSFILALLVPIYQEYLSAQSQVATDKKLETQADALEGQRKIIEALTTLVEKALVQEAKRQEERFVVRDRVAVVRAKPEHGSTVVGKLLPNEVVRPVSEDGKWIEFQYYHWLHQEYRTGWALKKYFQRVARPESNGPFTSVQPEAQRSSPKSLTQLIGSAKGAFQNAAEADAFVRTERDQWER